MCTVGILSLREEVSAKGWSLARSDVHKGVEAAILSIEMLLSSEVFSTAVVYHCGCV